jgi:hypothetical protein
LYRYM